ncbi:MAG: ABC transporter permease subunit [Bacteroidetes bacterium]|nr:ABC transporter permease subunit [Bacteroidota bacterium]
MISVRTSSQTDAARWGYLLFVAIAILPMGASLLYALAYSLGLAGLLGEGLTFDHWIRVLGNREVLASFALSIWVALAVAFLDTALGLPLGILLRRSINAGPLSYLIYLPLALPGVVVGFLAFQGLTGAGLLARVAAAFGLVTDPAQWVNVVNDRYGIGIILAQLVIGVPFFAILFARLYESEHVADLSMLAASLGASRRVRILRVTVPILVRRAFPTVMLYLVGVLGAYEIPLLLGAQSPQMISVLTMRKYAMFDLSQKPEAFICAIIYTAIALLLVTIAYRRRDDAQA